MIGELLFVALFCVVPVIIVGLVAYGLIQRMYHFQEVLADGVETEAVVVRKYERSPSFGCGSESPSSTAMRQGRSIARMKQSSHRSMIACR